MAALLRQGFVVRDSLEFKPVSGEIILSGEIACLGGIVISVLKFLEVLGGDGGEALVRTREYQYNASVRGQDNFLRHDNAHAHPGHQDAHHRHLYDWKTGQQSPGSPEWVGEDGWPTLAEFIQMAYAWYCDHIAELPDSFAVPELGLRSVLRAVDSDD